ncbi:Peroxisomal membrane PEX17 [Hyphodiscus hymeniophilus]|uniref:Peroxisomal membrane PEX17 n=1 Tax=Hyphodiscus hymeniophilus TaxID=353542 RepID=A0A9P6VHA6_9HELO|nr:Peroxisomal membrane PEX17 [Hyphodiscus hymeniophilus]
MKLEGALVTAANLSLEHLGHSGSTEPESVVLALTHAFPLLSDGVRRDLNYDALVMIMIQAMISREGYQNGHFLEPINVEVKQTTGNMFDWSAHSSSFVQLQRVAAKPFVSSMGPLSRLIAHAVENLRDPRRILEVRDHLTAFSENLFTLWQRNKLSEVDPSEETTFLTPETLRVTFPALWQLLKATMFAVVVVLRAIIGRTLIDPILSSKVLAPATASHALVTLQHLYFISSRLGANAFSAYTFVNMTSIDILSRYPLEARDFLRKIHPSQAGHIPAHPLLRNLDLFYLNTSEHFTLALSPADSDSLIITTASPYLNPNANAHLLEIFEAAHSATLAVLAAPQNADLTAKVIPFYVESLFNSFPKNLSPASSALRSKH